jgi:hypothetical protein
MIRHPSSGARRWTAILLALSSPWVLPGCGPSSAVMRPDSSVAPDGGNDGRGTDGGDGGSTVDPNKYDILFVIDDSPSMGAIQQKLSAQLPIFMQVLQALPEGVPSIHIAVISTDMGAPSDTSIGCSAAGDQAAFFNRPQGTCTATTLTAGATYLADDPLGITKNFQLADPAGLPTVFQCIGLLGTGGCGFPQPLAAIDRALGADGQGPAPLRDQGFLRDDAYLGIVIISNQDDCSAPAGSPIFSLNGGSSDLENPLGPLTHYRCNRAGHRCQDLNPQSPDTTFSSPPLNVPVDATAETPPTLTLSNCVPDETNEMLIPLSKIIMDIQSLKADPANQILVSAVTGVIQTDQTPLALVPNPYTIAWQPGAGSASNELWPQVQHLCGPAGPQTDPSGRITTDGSFADPAVRIAAFVNAFGNSGVLGSICDDFYAPALRNIASRIAALSD